eukprot:COSAG02_NODE_219_length_28538_cov_79.322058_10_plen_185_part_00
MSLQRRQHRRGGGAMTMRFPGRGACRHTNYYHSITAHPDRIRIRYFTRMTRYCRTLLKFGVCPLRGQRPLSLEAYLSIPALPQGTRGHRGAVQRDRRQPPSPTSPRYLACGTPHSVRATPPFVLERFLNVSHRSVSRVSDAEIASEILLVVSHLAMFLSHMFLLFVGFAEFIKFSSHFHFIFCD